MKLMTLLLLNYFGFSGVFMPDKINLKITSPKMIYGEDKVIMGSPVEFNGEKIKGQSWEAEYFPKDKKIILKGGMWANIGGDIISGEKCIIDLKRKEIYLTEGEVFQKKKGYYAHTTARSIQRKSDGTIILDDAVFTTCRCKKGESPSWSLKFKKAEMQRDGYLTVRNSYFRIKNRNTPFLYIPNLKIPSKISRQSGFLTPRFEYYKNLGFYLGLSYYQVLSEWSDATIDMDFYQEKGIGTGFEVREAMPYGGFGRYYFYYINEFMEKNKNQMWYLLFNHNQTVSYKKRLRLNISGRYYSNTAYLGTYSRYVRINYFPYWGTRLSLLKKGDYLDADVVFERYQVNKALGLSGYEDISMLRAEFNTRNYTPYNFVNLRADAGTFAYGSEFQNYGIYFKPLMRLQKRFIAYGVLEIEGQARYSNVNLEDKNLHFDTGYRSKAYIGIPFQFTSLVKKTENDTDTSYLFVSHYLNFEGGAIAQENWANFPYSITTGTYYTVWSPRSRGFYISIVNSFRFLRNGLSLGYFHYWIDDRVLYNGFYQFSEIRGSLTVMGGLMSTSIRALYDPERGLWKFINNAFRINFMGWAGANVNFVKNVNDEVISGAVSFEIAGIIRFSASASYRINPDTAEDRFKLIEDRYIMVYNSLQRCWSLSLGIIQRNVPASDGGYKSDTIFSFQIFLRGFGRWGRAEQI